MTKRAEMEVAKPGRWQLGDSVICHRHNSHGQYVNIDLSVRTERKKQITREVDTIIAKMIRNAQNI